MTAAKIAAVLHLARSTVARLLQREGLRVIFPQGQTCCAQPAFNCGYHEEARAVAEKFVREVHRKMVIVESDPKALLARFEAYEPPRVVKWIDAGTI